MKTGKLEYTRHVLRETTYEMLQILIYDRQKVVVEKKKEDALLWRPKDSGQMYIASEGICI